MINRAAGGGLKLVVGLCIGLAACGSVPEIPSASPTQATTAALPTATPTPAPAVVTTSPTAKAAARLSSTRENTTPQSFQSGGVELAVSRVAIVDYREFYEASGASTRQWLDGATSTTQGALTVGQINVKVTNTTSSRINIHPNQGTVVVGSEQMAVSLFASENVGGEFFPGVVKEGRVYFFLQRTPASSVSEVLYVVRGPNAAETFRSLGPELTMRFQVR